MGVAAPDQPPRCRCAKPHPHPSDRHVTNAGHTPYRLPDLPRSQRPLELNRRRRLGRAAGVARTRRFNPRSHPGDVRPWIGRLGDIANRLCRRKSMTTSGQAEPPTDIANTGIGHASKHRSQHSTSRIRTVRRSIQPIIQHHRNHSSKPPTPKTNHPSILKILQIRVQIITFDISHNACCIFSQQGVKRAPQTRRIAASTEVVCTTF